jgi:hypothetical protein
MFCNRNAVEDGRWDAVEALGNRNPYNKDSASWWAYERSYDATMKMLQLGLMTR